VVNVSLSLEWEVNAPAGSPLRGQEVTGSLTHDRSFPKTPNSNQPELILEPAVSILTGDAHYTVDFHVWPSIVQVCEIVNTKGVNGTSWGRKTEEKPS